MERMRNEEHKRRRNRKIAAGTEGLMASIQVFIRVSIVKSML